MRVEDNRVRAFDAGQGPFPLLRQDEEPAVRAVDVNPEPLSLRDLGEPDEVVHCACIGRARASDDEERRSPRDAVLRDPLFEDIEANPESRVRGDLADVLRREAREDRRLLDGMVRLVGGIESAGEEVLRKPLAAGRHERGEVRERPAARQDSPRRGRIPDHLAEPGDDVRFDLRETRSRRPDADEAVRRVCDEVRHGRVRKSAARDVRQVSRASRVEADRDHLLEEQGEKLLHRGASLGQRLSERARERFAPLGPERGLRSERVEVIRDPVGGELRQPSQLIARQLERRRLRGCRAAHRLVLLERCPARARSLDPGVRASGGSDDPTGRLQFVTLVSFHLAQAARLPDRRSRAVTR